MPFNFITNILLIIILILCIGWTASYISLKDKYTTEQLAYRDFKEQSLRAELVVQQQTKNAEQELQKEHDKQVNQLEHEIKNINDKLIVNKSELNSLHKLLNNNQSNFNTASASELVDYSTTLSNLLGECSTMVTEVSARADEATQTAITYHGMLVSQKEIVDTYNTQIKDGETSK